MVLQIKNLQKNKDENKYLEAKQSKNIYLTSLIDRLILRIKIDITKIHNPWIITDYGNIIPNGIFRYNKLFYQKGPTGNCRRIFSKDIYGNYLIWSDEDENRKVLSFKEYIADLTEIK